MPVEQAAEVLNQDGPKDNAEESSAVTKVTNQVDAEVDPQANANETDDENDNGHKRLGGWQRKIKRLQEQNETLIETLRKVGGNAQTAQEPAKEEEDKPPIKPVRPKQTDFDDWAKWETAAEKYEADRDKYYEDKLAYELRQSDTKKQQESQKQAVADGWRQQISEAKKEHADFEQVAFSEDVPMSTPMMEAIVTSEFGAKIAYELGQNPDEAERISKLSPIAAAREIGKIESRIAGTKPAATDQEEPEPAASRAPKPPVPVRKTSVTNHEPTDSDDYKTWLRKREAQLRSK